MCNHNWQPHYTREKISYGTYICADCGVLGVKDEGIIEMERCIGINCIAPATVLLASGILVCERCAVN